MHRLDDIDRLILAELQADGRMTNVELAKRSAALDASWDNLSQAESRA
ncbi:MAG: AsnC family transcriptional regulator, partial [Planktomarina sp.]